MRNVLRPSFEDANPNVRSQVESSPNHMSGNPTYQELRSRGQFVASMAGAA
jgi:hypothetical protein